MNVMDDYCLPVSKVSHVVKDNGDNFLETEKLDEIDSFLKNKDESMSMLGEFPQIKLLFMKYSIIFTVTTY